MAKGKRSRARSTGRRRRRPEPEPTRLPAEWVAPLLVAALIFLAYANATPNAVVHDDKFFFPGERVWTAAEIGRAFTEDSWAQTAAPSGVYRPLLLVSFALDSLWYGDDASGYHRTNVVLHVAAALVLYGFLRALLLGPRGGRMTKARRVRVSLGAGLAAAIFGVHPIHTEAVCSLFNRSEMFATIGVIGALWILWRWEPTHRIGAWLGAAGVYFVTLLMALPGIISTRSPEITVAPG